MSRPFHPSIPQATDNPSTSQPQLLDNNSSINSSWGINHVPLAQGSNRGLHSLINFVAPQSSDPSLTGLQSAMYTKTEASGQQLFFSNASQVRQLTGLSVINGTITNVIVGASTVITVAGHGLNIGNSVTVAGVQGATGINGGPYVISAVTANTFTVPVASAGAYTSGGTITSPQSLNYGASTPWGWIFNMGQTPLIGTGSYTINLAMPLQGGFVPLYQGLTSVTGVNQLGISSNTTTQLIINTSVTIGTARFWYILITK